jgi:hypothetical protein
MGTDSEEIQEKELPYFKTQVENLFISKSISLLYSSNYLKDFTHVVDLLSLHKPRDFDYPVTGEFIHTYTSYLIDSSLDYQLSEMSRMVRFIRKALHSSDTKVLILDNSRGCMFGSAIIGVLDNSETVFNKNSLAAKLSRFAAVAPPLVQLN